MYRTPITPDLSQFPTEFHCLLCSGSVFDSSSSPAAQVFYIDTDRGYFLKTAPKNTLLQEAELTRFYHSLGLSAPVLAYESLDRDWLLTERIPGEDCLNAQYLAQPERLCDTTALLLRQLHDTAAPGCPVTDLTARRLETARRNFEAGNFDRSLFPDNWGFRSGEEAAALLEALGSQFRADCLVHGDYCLPNILLDHWSFSGFIDLAAGGLGDRHFDLHWGLWSLAFNLKTDRYRDRFLDAYGRDAVREELLRAAAALEVFNA